MKKLVAVLAVAGTCWLVAACGDGSQDATDQTANSAEQIASSAVDDLKSSASSAVGSIQASASSAVGSAQDMVYVQALEAQSAAFGEREDQIAAAQTACAELSDGTSIDDTRTKIADETGLGAPQARALVNIAIPIYCPNNIARLTE
jgi:hypothetical protein